MEAFNLDRLWPVLLVAAVVTIAWVLLKVVASLSPRWVKRQTDRWFDEAEAAVRAETQAAAHSVAQQSERANPRVEAAVYEVAQPAAQASPPQAPGEGGEPWAC